MQDSLSVCKNLLDDSWDLRDETTTIPLGFRMTQRSQGGNGKEQAFSVRFQHGHGLRVLNQSQKSHTLCLHEVQRVPEWAKKCSVSFSGTRTAGAATLYVNEVHAVPFAGRAHMSVMPGQELRISIRVDGETNCEIDRCEITYHGEDYTEASRWETKSSVLVVTPAYPSSANFYLCAFVHTRVKAYLEAGLSVDVVCADASYWYEREWEHEGVKVYAGNYASLKAILHRGVSYEAIVTHFVNHHCLEVFDGYALDRRLFFVCHGAEILCETIANETRPYFTPEKNLVALQPEWRKQREAIRRYANDPRCTWIFVSEFLRRKAETAVGVTFGHTEIIHNHIDADRFHFREKEAELRKKILVCRRFDSRQYSVDLVVLCILTLSQKSFFKELEFHLYGDGAAWETLRNPLRQFSNVIFHRKFVPNAELPAIHATCGIALFPSRFDTQGVAIAEAALSGLVPIGTRLGCYEGFFPKEVMELFAPQEDYLALAEAIERLYHSPELFCRLSRAVGKDIRTLCSKENTVGREIALLRAVNRPEVPIFPKGDGIKKEKLLTIIIPAYNIEAFLPKCFFSLLNQPLRERLEILCINDGSTDGTLALAKRYEAAFPSIFRVIDKPNGGHGSGINRGIAEATGRYLRVIDGDDWVVSENLAEELRRLETETVDCVLTLGQHEYAGKEEMDFFQRYDNLSEGVAYRFDNLMLEGFGFTEYGPILPTATIRTACLKKDWPQLDEKCAYVDMEFNVFAAVRIDTVRYYALDIYRYFIGREGQTVSRDFWKRKWKDHLKVLQRLVEFAETTPTLSFAKKRYIEEHILWQLIDSQVFMFDTLKKWEELEAFLLRLERYPRLSVGAIRYMIRRNSDCKRILETYQANLTTPPKARTPYLKMLEKQLQEHALALNNGMGKFIYDESFANKRSLRYRLKLCLPYGLVRMYQKRRYGV